jgi:hypothetical protein
MPSGSDDHIWELFHENSKIHRHTHLPFDDIIRERVLHMSESLPFDRCPAIDLPASRMQMGLSMEDAIITRLRKGTCTGND